MFKNSLKESIKDALVHYNKLKDLQAIIKLATKINNRLREQAQ